MSLTSHTHMHRCLLSPSVYTGFLVWTLCCSNPLMLVLAYFVVGQRPKLDLQSAVVALVTATFVCTLGAACALVSMEGKFRFSFFKHCTMQTYARKDIWALRTRSDTFGKVVDDQDTARAEAIVHYNKAYLPVDLAKEFLRKNWCVPCCDSRGLVLTLFRTGRAGKPKSLSGSRTNGRYAFRSSCLTGSRIQPRSLQLTPRSETS